MTARLKCLHCDRDFGDANARWMHVKALHPGEPAKKPGRQSKRQLADAAELPGMERAIAHLRSLKYTGKGHEDDDSLIGMFARGIRHAIRSLEVALPAAAAKDEVCHIDINCGRSPDEDDAREQRNAIIDKMPEFVVLAAYRAAEATVARLQQENADLAGEIVGLRAALRPFGSAARDRAEYSETALQFGGRFTVSDLRRAARLADPERTNDKPDVSKKAGIIDMAHAAVAANTERSDADG